MAEQHAMLALTVAQIFIGAMLFLLFASMRKKTPDGGVVGSTAVREFEILKRNDKTIAIFKEIPFRRWPGLVYAGGFYFAAPVLIWRYGILKTLFMIAIPIGIGAAGAVPVSGSGGMALGMLLALIMRGWIGVFIAKRDLIYYRGTLLRRGWSSVGFEVAKTKKLAVKQFHSG
jgi:hypothetical protein